MRIIQGKVTTLTQLNQVLHAGIKLNYSTLICSPPYKEYKKYGVTW